MKRYRCTSFFIDCIRNTPDKKEIEEYVISRYGERGIEDKLKRYLSFKPSSLAIIGEYHDLLQEIDDSYILGLYYPALTASCCLGERIFNILILRLMDYHKTSQYYKNIYSKESLTDWTSSINILRDWKVIDSEDISSKYLKLEEIRHGIIHFRKLDDIEEKTQDALVIIHDITTYFFAVGKRNDIYFLCSGEIYVKKQAEQVPFVKEIILPHCVLVGYKHKVESLNKGELFIKDENGYELEEISDEEFCKLRTNMR